jgi:hypothetical protein
VELGLIDGLSDLRSFMRGKYGDKVKLELLEGRKSWLQKTLGLGSQSVVSEAVGSAIGAAKAEAEWNKYGL